VCGWIVVALCCAGFTILSLLFPAFSFSRDFQPQATRVAQVEGPTVPRNKGAAEQSESSGFSVDHYVVDGNTLLSQEAIDAILAKHKGAGKQFKDLDQARIDLEKAYHEAGYPTVLVMLPEQTVEQGTVRLQVIEAILADIKVTGNRYFSRRRILEKLPSLKIGEVLYEPSFSKELGALQINPDRKVAPVLNPGPEPGTVSLELKVTDRLPVHGKIEGDNRGPITTPVNRLVAQVQHTNLFGGDEILTVNTVQTPTDWGAVQNYGASFVYPVIWPSHYLAVYGSYSKSNSVLAGSALSVGTADVGIAGNAIVAGFRYNFPIFTGGDSTHQLSIGMDYKHLAKTEGTFPGGLGTVTVLSPVQYTPMSLAYSGVFPDRLGVSSATASVKGYVAGMIPGGDKEDFGGTPDPNNPGQRDPNNPGNRQGSTGTFAVVQGRLERTQPLIGDFTLALLVDGQWASQPLIPAELYFAGGMDTVRGYLNYETAGDNAVRGRAELTTPELFSIPIDRIWQRKKSAEWYIRLRLAAFYDAAQLWVLQPGPLQNDHFRLEGTGFGVRVKFPKDVGELKVDQGWALQPTPSTQRGHSFVHFSVGLTF
jgi:hemolysin activation/secretion protein